MRNLIKRYLAFLIAIILVTGMFPLQSYADTLDLAAITTDQVESSNTTSVKIKGARDYTYAFKVLTLVNKERKAAGLDALTMDTRLLDTAMKRAAECQVLFVASHSRPDNSECFTAYPDGDDGFTALGENIAVGQDSPQSVMTSWMNSTGHRENILKSYYNVIGIGCYKIGNYYTWVQSFGTTSDISKADSSSYSNGKKTYTIQAVDSNLNFSINLSRSSVAKKSTAKVSVQLATSGFEYNKFSIPASQFTYSSSNKKVATVDSNGKVTAKSAGKTKITVKYKSTGKKVAKAVTVTVK